MSTSSRCFINSCLCVITLSFALVSGAFSDQTYNLSDYYGPTTVGTTWLYSGKDWDGLPSDTRMEIISTQKTITSYTGETTATPYSVHVIDILKDYGFANPDHSITNRDYTDKWHDYITVSNGYRMWGSDDDEASLRVDGGLPFGNTITLGQTNSNEAPVYDSGSYFGEFRANVTLLDVSNVTVPAGTFANCLHLRFSLSSVSGEGTQTSDEWWALGVGVVKFAGVSGDGSGQLGVLEWYNFTVNPPTDPSIDPPGDLEHSIALPGINSLLLQEHSK